jgi:GH15 family glucan-1,4-alpha-glucosidase
MKTIEQSYEILDQLRLPHGLYLASPSSDYSYVWIRDSVYMSLPYLNKDCNTYEKTYWRLLDLFKEYEYKITIHTVKRPQAEFEYIHARYSASDVKEIHGQEWGHAQHDAIGAVLWGIATGEKHGKKIFRDWADYDIIQKVVRYLVCCEYWHDPDNGMWEEDREVHMSSIGACVAGLNAIKDYVGVRPEWIENGYKALRHLGLMESATKAVDLAQLSLIYPYKIIAGLDARILLNNITHKLLRLRGVARYEGDSYYSTQELLQGRGHPREFYYGTEAEWCFGLPWLALCYYQIGEPTLGKRFVKATEDIMLEDGVLPELYYANTDKPNPNTPLGWSQAMYILAKEALQR